MRTTQEGQRKPTTPKHTNILPPVNADNVLRVLFEGQNQRAVGLFLFNAVADIHKEAKELTARKEKVR